MSKDITVEQLFSMMQEMQSQNVELRREHTESIERLERQRAENIERLERQNAESVERLERQHAELRREIEEKQRERDEKQREHIEREKNLERKCAERRLNLWREHLETEKKLEHERAERRWNLWHEHVEGLKKRPHRDSEYNSKNATISPKKPLDNNAGEDISDNRAQHILQTCLSVCKSPCWISYALASSFVVAAAILSVVFVDGVAEEVKIGVMCGVSAGTCIASIIVLAAHTMREQRGGCGVV